MSQSNGQTKPSDLPQWVTYRLEERDAKQTKVPYSPRTRLRASVTDPSTWTGIEEARKALADAGAADGSPPFDGVGFVLSEEDPFCAIDIDRCVDPSTHEIEPSAEEIINFLDSYAEFSPSGTGVHVLVRGKLPAGRRRKGRIEMYDRHRYLTVTGEKLNTRGIEHRQEELESLHRKVFGANRSSERGTFRFRSGLSNQDIVSKAMTSGDGEKFSRLWNGDAGGYQSQSEADLAMCRMLSRWTGPDPSRIADLLAQSGLYREKWDRPDYRERTIQKALEDGEIRASLRLKRGSDTNGWHTGKENFQPVSLPEAVEFPVSALPSACRRLIEEGTEAIGCAPDLLGMPILSTLAAGIGATRVVEIKRSWREGTTLFLAVVASPGDKKTPAAKIARRPILKRQSRMRQKHKINLEEHARDMREWEVHKRLAARNDEPSPPPTPAPTMERCFAEDTTVESLVQIQEENPRGVLVFRDELAGWVRSLDQYKGGRGSDRQHWLSFWSNEPVIVDRKSRQGDPVYIEHPWLTLFGGIQPAMLSELGGSMEDGLLDRFLFAYPATTRSRFSDKEISPEAEEGYHDLYEGLCRLRMVEDERGETSPSVVPMSSSARQEFAEIHDALSRETLEPGFPVRLQGVWAKMQGYVARLALILALCRGVENRAPEQVEREDVSAAGQLVRYFKAHARRVYSELKTTTPEDTLARELREFLEEKDGRRWTGSATELYEALAAREVDGLPASPEWLSRMALSIGERVEGVDVHKGKRNGSRVLRLQLKSAVPAAPSDLLPNLGGDGRDGKDGTTDEEERF